MSRAGGRCFDKACELLARRRHFRLELERKLSDRGFDGRAVREALERLTELGYVDDAEAARELALGPLTRRGYGPQRMRAELLRRGAPEETIDEAVRSAFSEGEEEVARRVARRWLGRQRADLEALARHLNRKGFSAGVVYRLARELTRDSSG